LEHAANFVCIRVLPIFAIRTSAEFPVFGNSHRIRVDGGAMHRPMNFGGIAFEAVVCWWLLGIVGAGFALALAALVAFGARTWLRFLAGLSVLALASGAGELVEGGLGVHYASFDE
jgi:hypothetical protein